MDLPNAGKPLIDVGLCRRSFMRARGCVAGLLGGAVLRGLLSIIKAIFKALINILVFTGLWIPLIYVLIGVVLKLTGTLDPLSKENLDSLIYQGGFWITIGFAALITFKNLFFPSKRRQARKQRLKEEARERRRAKRQGPAMMDAAPQPTGLDDGIRDVGFEQKPAPLENYPSKLSWREKREIRKISKQAKADARFRDESISEPIDGGQAGAIPQVGEAMQSQPGANQQYPSQGQFHGQQYPSGGQFHAQQYPSGGLDPFQGQAQPLGTGGILQGHSNACQPMNPNESTAIQYNPMHPSNPTTMPYNPANQQYVPSHASIPAKDEESPKIYLSKVEPDTLIHEFSDRFEVYKMVDGEAVKDRVEYKRDFD